MAKIYLIFFTFLFAHSILYSQNQDVTFGHLTTEDGFSSGGVYSILQDHQGMMWFGTLISGVVKYDGNNFTAYKNIPGDSTSLSNNYVEALHEDRSGRIWVGTRSAGLCRFDRETDRFIRYSYQKDDTTSLCSSTIVSIFESVTNGQNTLWVGSGRGLNRYNADTDNFTRYFPDKNREGLTTNVNWIYSIVQDSSGRVWIGTFNEGLYYYDSAADRFIRYVAKEKYSNTFKNKYLFRICATREEDQDILWMSTFTHGLYKINISNDQITHYFHDSGIFNYGFFSMYAAPGPGRKILWLGGSEGLYKFDIKSENYIVYKNEPANSTSLNSNIIRSIMEDKSGILWVGNDEGIDIINPQQSNFTTFESVANLPNGLNSNGINSFCETDVGGRRVMYIGTSGGIYQYVWKTGKFICFKHDPENANSLTSDFIYSLIISQHSRRNYLWAATPNGLNRINLHTGQIKRFYIETEDSDYHNIMKSIVEDEAGRIWIGTQGNVLFSFNPVNETFTRHSQPGTIAFYSCFDSFGNMWGGRLTGVGKLHISSEKFTRYRNIKNDSTSLSDNDVLAIYEDKNRDIWIGTAGGLNRYDRDTDTFSHFTEKDGLPSDVIMGILEDDHGNLWIGTGDGISKFDPVNKTFRNYDTGDGLLENYCKQGSEYKNSRGEMFFGFSKGFTMFHPDKIKENRSIPAIIISDFQIFNKSIRPGKKSILKKQISQTSEITLPYDQSVFSFEFAALDYHNPQKNQYAHKMDGVDPDWVYTNSARRFATYTNLDPGEYTFRVKGSNNDGIWNETGTSVKVIVLPPWWRANWAYTMYLFLIGFFATAAWRFQSNRLKMRQQLQMEHFEAEKLREVDHLKSRFFTNISHEFRTPLTLIMGPIKQLLDGNPIEKLKDQYKMILLNSDRLLGLINQILDLSKLESGEMKLEAAKTDLIQHLRGLVFSFSSLAERKNITLNFSSIAESLIAYTDRDKLEKIISNLLSNVFKFTPEGGEVETAVSKPIHGDKGMIQISISNTGPGIPADQLDKIFDRFYQTDNNYHKDGESTGIGLALAKELVEVCHGEISVESKPGAKTTFYVLLPLGKEYLSEEEIIEEDFSIEHGHEPPIDLEPGGGSKTAEQYSESESKEQKSQTKKPAPLLLIVEDNPDVCAYISGFLENEFHIITADNGVSGLKMTLNKYPDLIISDVMMPEMDGFEMCQKIKSDERISHIPIILLTAKADIKSKIEGLECAADDYLSKPFEADELKVRTRNLIEQRRKMREKYAKLIDLQPQDIAVSSMDEEMLRRLLSVFEDHIDQSEFSTEELAREIGMSRMHLNRKLKALTNLSTHEFIKTLRLKRAAQLLNKAAGTVSEVAYQVGFNNVSHFSKAFRKQFGQSPGKYSSTNKEIL